MLESVQTAAAVEAATLLLTRAIQDTRKPVADLCSALQRMHRAVVAGEPVARDLAVCIESVQFHDRLVQQLAFARDLLALILKHKPLDIAAYGAPRWHTLLDAIHHSVPPAERFELSDLLASPRTHGVQGSCELFD
ncbi:MAG: hypothetical protein ACREVV_19110 [Steroidobacteraceae bacterium]